MQAIVDHIRANSHASAYSASMAPAVVQQVISSMRIIMGEDGTDNGLSHLACCSGRFMEMSVNYVSNVSKLCQRMSAKVIKILKL